MLRQWRRIFCEQSRADSCVPACMAMARAWAEEQADVRALEDDYARALLTPQVFGVPLHVCRDSGFLYRYESTGDNQLVDPVTSTALEVVEAELDEHPVVVTVCPGPLLQERAEDPWSARSRHGRLIQFPEQPLPFHAVLLIGVEGRRFVHLDPYLPVKYQPLRISRGGFAYAWTGEWARWNG